MENNTNVIDEKKLNEILTVSATPHIRSSITSSKIMLDVVIALVPALAAGVYFFGIKALAVTATAVIFAVLSEFVFQKITKKPITINDLSAVVTGILLAFNVPVTMPLYMVAFGSFFAVVVVKQLFGGIGNNFMNPALAARAALMASWPKEMSNFVAPGVDAVATATPLSNGDAVGLMDAFIGKMPGTIGEVSAVCLLIGALYLIIKKVISIRIPVVYILSTVAFLAAFGIPTGKLVAGDLISQVLYGGLILGAFFMATDYVTAPVSKKGQVVFAIGCGLITAAIRIFGNMPEGVSYSILVMNIASPLIEKVTTPKAFGKGGKK